MTASAQFRIARLAALPAVHRAFHWLHLHQLQLRQWHWDLLHIPAPPFGEQPRALWFVERFHALGLTDPHLDAAGNAVATLLPSPPDAPYLASQISDGPAQNIRASYPHILISAHLDTVFPADTPSTPTESGTRILGPGACDNAAGLSGLLAIAAALRHANFNPPVPILFAANVGEEGEGNLRGMRHIFNTTSTGTSTSRHIAAAIALEGSGATAAVTQALASRRLRITITGPGGHSWTDAGAPNPILILSRALLALESIPTPPDFVPRATLNIGHISGGTSINSIPESATALLDLRSTSPAQLESKERALRIALEQSLQAAALPASVKLHIDLIGDRPGGELPAGSPLLATLHAVDRHLNLRTELKTGSTDANIPLSLGIPALAIGAGGLGGGIHTLQEWYDPTGRQNALRRILLLLLDTAHLAAEPI